MPTQDVVQHRLVDLRRLKQLLDPREVLVTADARSDRDDVLRSKNFRRYAFGVFREFGIR